MTNKNDLELLLNQHANKEFIASHLYLMASFYTGTLELKQMTKFLLNQSEDERKHGLSVYDFILRKQLDPDWYPIAMKKPKWKSLTEVFKDILDLEIEVGTNIEKIVKIVNGDEGDNQTFIFFSELNQRQIDEIEEAHRNYEMVQSFDNGEKLNLFLLDREF